MVDRKNHTVEECVKAMLHDQHIPQFQWGEACMTIVYLQNRSPHRILNNMTLEEAFTGKKPSVDHLRIFGCPMYIHIPKDKRKKLDPTSLRGIFVGYSASSKAYIIYIKEDNRIEVSRYVIFDESIAYKKSKDVLVNSDEEEIPIFEDISRDNDGQEPRPTQDVEGPCEPI